MLQLRYVTFNPENVNWHRSVIQDHHSPFIYFSFEIKFDTSEDNLNEMWRYKLKHTSRGSYTWVSLAPKKLSPLLKKLDPLLKSWSHFPMTPFLPSSIWGAYRLSPCIIRTFLPRNLRWEVGAYYATEHKIVRFFPQYCRCITGAKS